MKRDEWVPGVPERPYWLEWLRNRWLRTVGLVLGYLIAAGEWLWRRMSRE